MDAYDAILLVGHGTRDEAGTREFFELTERLTERLGEFPVAGCLLEFQHPTIAEAWKDLVERGARQIRVAPLLLFAAGHAKQDIPDEVRRCAEATPHVTFTQAGPLSRAPALVELLTRRVGEACDRDDELKPESTTVVFVGRGNRDPCAQADMRVLAEVSAARLAAKFGLADHEVAFYAMCEPRLPDVLDQVAVRAGVDSVVVQPHLLFQGRLYDAIKRQVAEAAERHPGVRFVIGDYLGPVTEVAAAIEQRAMSQPSLAKTP